MAILTFVKMTTSILYAKANGVALMGHLLVVR